MSGEIWLPQWERVNLGGPTGAPYKDTDNIKLLWHDWEGTNWQAAESAFKPYPPHVAAKYPEKPRQYVPLDEHAYALLGSANEGEFVIQVELAGFAHSMRDMTEDEQAWVATEVLEPILFFHDVPDVHPPFYDDQDGLTLASKYSPIRFAFSDWVAYSGHVGHQHAPNPDDHWDPGRLPVDNIIRLARANGHKTLEKLGESTMPAAFIYNLDMDTLSVDDNGDLVTRYFQPKTGWAKFVIGKGCRVDASPVIVKDYMVDGVTPEPGRLDVYVEAKADTLNNAKGAGGLAHAWYNPAGAGAGWHFEVLA